MNITQHAKERYTERIIGKDTKADINLYIQENDEKIKDNLNKMMAYGKCIYSGTSCTNKGQSVDVYVKDTWILLVDNKYENLITLYKADLNVGDDFNKEYVDRMLDKLEEAKVNKEKVAEEVRSKCEEMRQTVQSNMTEIANYRNYIKALENQNESYNTIISTMQIDNLKAEQEVKDIVNKLVNKKEF